MTTPPKTIGQYAVDALLRNDRKGMALSLAVQQVAIDAVACGLASSHCQYTVQVEQTYVGDANWMTVSDNEDGEIAELEWDGAQWVRHYTSSMFARLMESEE